MNKKAVALSAAAAAAVSVSALNLKLTRIIGEIDRQSLDEALKWQQDHYDTTFFNDLQKEEYTVPSYDSYKLHVICCRAEKHSDKYVIISHGHTDNRYGCLKYMKIYLDLGFNCIIYDLRGHGVNKKTFCTYSIREGMDLSYIIDDTYRRFGKNIHIGLHGESLGAATSINVLKYRPKVDFVVADCGFSEIESVIKNGMKSMHLPQFLYNAAAVTYKAYYGFSISKMKPIDSLNNNHVPVCFIHGADDRFVPPAHSRKMYERTKGYTELHIIANAEHAGSVLTAPEEYKKIVTEFIGHAVSS